MQNHITIITIADPDLHCYQINYGPKSLLVIHVLPIVDIIVNKIIVHTGPWNFKLNRSALIAYIAFSHGASRVIITRILGYSRYSNHCGAPWNLMRVPHFLISEIWVRQPCVC